MLKCKLILHVPLLGKFVDFVCRTGNNFFKRCEKICSREIVYLIIFPTRTVIMRSANVAVNNKIIIFLGKIFGACLKFQLGNIDGLRLDRQTLGTLGNRFPRFTQSVSQ